MAGGTETTGNGFGGSVGSPEPQRRRPGHPQKKGSIIQQVLFLKFAVGNPDRFLSQLLPWFRWSTGPAFFLVWVVLLAYSSFTLSQNWQPFVQATTGAVLPQNWFFLGINYVFLKLIHEIWHGIFAKRHGAVVPEWGVQLLLFVTPMTYVDASGSWRFPEPVASYPGRRRRDVH